jgi:hypothetical protein
MAEPRKVKSKFCDFTSDGTLIVHGHDGEHLIVDLGHAPFQIAGLKSSLDKYVAYYEAKEIKALNEA